MSKTIMAVSSINMMRVSQNMQSYSLLESLRSNTLKLYLEQSRLSSGSKLNSPSEDPGQAGRATQLSELLERQQQILAGMQQADGFLNTSDSAVTEVSSLLTDAHNIALTMVSDTASSEERASEAQLVLGLIGQLVTIGNRQYNGMYLFGGQQTRQTPFTQDHGVAEYRGDTEDLNVNVDAGQNLSFNMTGAELFGALTNRMKGTVDLQPAITDGTRLADCDGVAGRGIQRGLIRITLSSPAVAFTVDLRQADTVGDVIDMVNDAAAKAGLTVGTGQAFNIDYNSDRSGLQVTAAAGAVTVDEVGDGLTARDLGIRGTGSPTLTGGDLSARLTAMTTIASLFGGTGATLGTLHIDNGSLTADVDLNQALTLQDVINRINTAGVDVMAQINENGTGLDIINKVSGSQMKISDSGDGTATLLGIRTFHGGTLLSELNEGAGVQTREGHADLQINAKNGATFTVSLSGALTVQDVLDRVNAAAGTAGVAVTASLAVNGNGIRIVDSTGGAGELQVAKADLSPAIDGLGLLKSTSGTEIVSDDTNGIVVDSAFTALNDLYEGLIGNDVKKISSAAAKLESFIGKTTALQGKLGARSKAMTTRLQSTEDAVVSTQSLLSQVRDVDYTEAVTRFQQAQTTLQASLITGSKLMQMSLLDYLS